MPPRTGATSEFSFDDGFFAQLRTSRECFFTQVATQYSGTDEGTTSIDISHLDEFRPDLTGPDIVLRKIKIVFLKGLLQLLPEVFVEGHRFKAVPEHGFYSFYSQATEKIG